MNIARNMEAIFVLVLGTLVAQGVATAAINAKPVNASVATYTVNDAGIAVVTVTAKRLTAAQKAVDA
ncbi:hypothetical protein [Pseudoduganella sp. GCM10020061]|uniref:hypothetical protein n=1 Tax=Pseudoduganella sp. GCM10020061 TaxID=3317345 RepID=UPI003627C346